MLGLIMSTNNLTKIIFGHLLPVLGEGIDKGELIVEGGKIKEVSRRRSVPFEGTVIDLSDCLILPGFVNAHCHLSLSVLHGRVPLKEKFTEWAEALVMWNRAVPLAERIRYIDKGAEALVRSGVTTLADYLAQTELLPEYQALPFRMVVFLEVLQLKSSAVSETVAKIGKVVDGLIPQTEMFSLGLAPHAPYSVSPALFLALRAMAKGRPLSCHVAELAEEVRFLKEGGGDLGGLFRKLDAYDEAWRPPGLSPARYLDSLGVLDSMIAVHLNHAEEDLDLLRAKNVSAVFCPGSTRWFGRDHYMPVRRFLDKGIAVGLGTDSLASNHSLDFFREMRVAEEMLPDVSRQEILHMATRGGAIALGLPTGAIVPGMAADLIAVRVERPQSGRWLDALFDPRRIEADFVMVDGKTILSK
jgi:cytosine/adenosine deaminase-related metal-dependent hydrolase